MKKKPLKPVKNKCLSCPFRVGSDYAYLASTLAECALSKASRICHSTGSNNAIHKRTGKKPMLCRGARDIQLRVFHSIGFIEAPTDKAWDKKCNELNL
ncbi:MAG TPA: hypothetical protein VFQ26_10240 [Nitrospiraceae bacterium]|nr:hypothetical protein [Nitrospiraceae bacterium]